MCEPEQHTYPLVRSVVPRELLLIENDYYDGVSVMNVEAVGTHAWTVAQAKAKLSEVIDKAPHHGPQLVTRNGKAAVVVVHAANGSGYKSVRSGVALPTFCWLHRCRAQA